MNTRQFFARALLTSLPIASDFALNGDMPEDLRDKPLAEAIAHLAHLIAYETNSNFRCQMGTWDQSDQDPARTIPKTTEDLTGTGGVSPKLNGVGEDQALFDPSVVRGLEYYTGAVFEAELLAETSRRRRASRCASARSAAADATTTWWRASPASARRRPASPSASRAWPRRWRPAGAPAEAEARGPVVVIAFDQARMADYFARGRRAARRRPRRRGLSRRRPACARR